VQDYQRTAHKIKCSNRMGLRIFHNGQSYLNYLTVNSNGSSKFNGIFIQKGICRSVEEAFIQLYDQGIIHRAIRPINWCCALKSAISDAEVHNEH
jgi:hypothetical protein